MPSAGTAGSWRASAIRQLDYLGVASCKQASPLHGDTGDLNSVTFSPDGQMLATVGDDGTVRLWDVVTRQQVGNPLDSGTGSVGTVAFSPNGRSLATVNYDGTIRLWDIARLVGTTTLTSRISPTAPSEGWRSARTARSWPARTRTPPSCGTRPPTDRSVGGPLTPADGDPETSTIAFSPNGQMVAPGIRNDIQLWDAVPALLLGRLRPGVPKRGPPPPAGVQPGRRVPGGRRQERCRLVVRCGQPCQGRHPYRLYPQFRVRRVAFSPDGRILAVGGGDYVQLWDVRDQRQTGKSFVNTNSSDNTISWLAFSVDSRTLAVGTLGGTVQMYMVPADQRIGELLTIRADTDVAATAVTFDPRGRFLAVGSKDGDVRIWNVLY